MNKNIFFLLFLIIPNLNYSQQKNLFEVGIDIVGADFSYERNLSNKFSVRSCLGYNGSIYRTSGRTVDGKKNVFVLQPNIKIQPRFYYNKQKRVLKDRNTNFNSADFLSVNLEYLTSELNISNAGYYEPEIFTVGLGWNLRRNIKNTKFIYELSTGLNYFYNTNEVYKDDNKIRPQFNFRFAYNII